MKTKSVFLAIAAVLFFALGWFLSIHIKSSTATPNEKKIERFLGSADSLEVNQVVDYPNKISGKFILAESGCAGFNFISKSQILWTNEIACFDPDSLKLRWLDNNTFMTRSTQRVNQGCPPKVEIYKIVSFDGRKLVLNSIHTGWNESPDSKLELTKRPE